MTRLLITTAMLALLAAAPTYAASDTGGAAIPLGITLKNVRLGVGVSPPGSNGNQPRERLIFADSKGATLYVSEKDPVGKSACDAECAKEWVPFIAAADAKPAGGWTVIARDDGARQWAFRGKPMYTYTKDAGSKPPAPRNIGGASPVVDVVNPTREYGGNVTGQNVDGRSIVEIQPEGWTTIPAGVTIDEVRAAPGQVLVDLRGLPFYTFDGKVSDPTISAEWKPFTAPQIALPIGDFTLLARQDGSKQWAFRGKPLYRFKGDLDYGDANGQYADKRFQVAQIMRYFMPSNVVVAKSHYFAGLLTTTEGKVLYAREQGRDGVDYAARADRGDPLIGARIGITSCDAECEKTWQPLLAPADAQPAGYWTLYSRPDGKKQWAYYGYAMYTNAEDKPGQMSGNMLYDSVSDRGTAAAGQQQVNLGMRWRVAPP